MDISRISSAYGAKPYQNSIKSSRKEAPDKSAAVPKEQVELSDTSKTVQLISDTTSELPEVRLELVEQIKSKIKYNGYPLESNLYKAIENLVEKRII
ncbi:MAG: flagellar biosynthesis anti-sigma factor FlgM [Chitinispirillaceae bacterium]|nr:flagellar biosynthesis anti-sigma factor FlgM [Chitinispirillaceae bacterium]